MKELILTVGLPRSGKSTWAKEQGYPIVNPDAIRLALHGKPFISEAEGFVWQIAYTMAKSLFLAGHEKVIIDATNTTKKRREEWINRFKDCEVSYMTFNTPPEICIQRAKNCGREDLIPVIERMVSEYEPAQ